MCHSITINKSRKIARIKAWGEVNSLEIKDIYSEVVGHQDWDIHFSMLCDYNNIKNFEVTVNDIYTITEWLESIDNMIGNGRCAVVASNDLIFGMNRIWQTLSSGRSQQFYVFRKMNDAVDWLYSSFG